MRAYSCIDSHGRWTEIPTQVQFSTSTDAHPPQPPSRTSNVSSDVIDIAPDEESEENEDNVPEEQVTAYDVLDVIRKYSSQAPRSDATACSVSPKIKSPSDATSCAASPAQALSVTGQSGTDDRGDEDDPDDDPDDNALKKESAADSLEETTACAAPPAQALPRDVIRGQKIRMTGRLPTAPLAQPRPDLQGVHPRNRPPFQNRSRTPTASYGTRARATRIRISRSRMPKAASRTKSI
jgi:hypothetical protein